MPQPTSIASHRANIELLQQAIESPKGLLVRCKTPAEATTLRFSLYAARAADRRENKKLYPIDHVMHNKSHFEDLRIFRVGSNLNIVKAGAIQAEVEELT